MPRRNYSRVYGGVAPDDQLGSGSVSCLRPEVETESLVRSNERQDHRSVYLDMLEQFVYPQVTAFQSSIIYLQAVAPPHWSMDVRGSLNATFPNRRIGRDGPICWPSHSPDLTLLDYILWGYVKDRIFATQANDIGELRTRTRGVISTITGEILTRTLQEFEYRLDIVRATNGAHVEVY